MSISISTCCQISLLRGRSRCSWCSTALASLLAPGLLPAAAGAGTAPGTRATQAAQRRAWIQHCLRSALQAPALRSGPFSAEDLRVSCPLSRVAITRQLQSWAQARECIDGAVVEATAAVALGAGRQCALWRLRVAGSCPSPQPRA